MQIIKKRQYIKETSYELVFEWVTTPGGGFGFPCDADGKVNTHGMSIHALRNLADCKAGVNNVKPGIVQENKYSYSEPAIGLCNHCEREVELSGFTNTCDCGADYNMSGQELAPRCQWGEETGESLADILQIP